ATIRLACNQPIEEAALGDSQSEPVDAGVGRIHQVVIKCVSQGDPLFLTATVRTGAANEPFSLTGTYRLDGEKADRAREANRLFVPWAPLATESATQSPVLVPDLAGGDPARGRELFAGDQARCSQCHIFRGQGGQAGPDLTDISRK